MVNIQIRGNLIQLDLKTFPQNETFNTIINSDSNDDIKDYIKKTITKQKVIYRNTLPIIDSNSELHITSFENDNYYDDGHTFFRQKLYDVKSENKDLKIPIDIFKDDYFLLNVKYGYGAGFETEIMDLDYENFETENLEIYEAKFFGDENSIVHSIKLNYLYLEDLGRNKFDFAKRKYFIIKRKHEGQYFLSSDKLLNQVEIISTIDWE